MKTLKNLYLVALLSIASVANAAGVNINKADAETIAAEISGIGQSRAQAIVEYRKVNGKFKSIDDLAKVKGIGEKTIKKNRSNISL